MINNSYYDDISLVKETLDRVEGSKESNEVLLESFNNLNTLHQEFSNIARDSSPIDEVFKKSYDKLTEAYIAFESLASHVDPKCKTICSERTRVTRLSYVLLDDRSKIIKTQLFVGGEIPVEYLKEVNRLWKESSHISFCMNREDRDITTEIEEYVNTLQ